MIKESQQLKAVVVGGGTGIYSMIHALLRMQAAVSTIVTVADSGGSTGRIRDEFGFQAVGDLRQSLAALADKPSQEWIRKLLLYRFEKGNGLKGHNLGNLMLTALQDLTGSTTQALEVAETIFDLEGSVIPTTESVVDIEVTYENGEVIRGEHILDEKVLESPIRDFRLVPACQLNPKAHQAIINADIIVIGPGDLYGSVLASLAPNGAPTAFAQTKATIVYCLNLMTRRTQTSGLTAKDHVAHIENAIGRPVDVILVHKGTFDQELLAHYQSQGEQPVEDDLHGDTRIVRADLVSEMLPNSSETDVVERSYFRHDSEKLQRVLKTLTHHV